MKAKDRQLREAIYAGQEVAREREALERRVVATALELHEAWLRHKDACAALASRKARP